MYLWTEITLNNGGWMDRVPSLYTGSTRGNQKFLQLGYKKLTYYVIYILSFFDICSCNISAFFQLFFSAVYALKIEFSVLTLKPCLDSDRQWFIICEVPRRRYFRFLIRNDHWEPSLDCRQDGSVEQIHSRGELAEQPMTCALVHCHEKVKL